MVFNPDCAVDIVARVEKPKRNAERALQQGLSGRSSWLLHNLGSMVFECIFGPVKFLKRFCRMKKFLFFLSFFLLICLPMNAASSDLSSNKTENAYKKKILALGSLVKSIHNISEDITELQERLKSPRAIGREKELRERIDKAVKKKRELELSFNRLSAGVELSPLKEEKAEGLDWNKELKEVLGPVVMELKEITSHPREIERLRGEVDFYRSRLQEAGRALDNLDSVLDHATDPLLIKELKDNQRIWKERERAIRTQEQITAQQLEQRMAERKPVSQSFRDICSIFLKRRGRNLVFSLLAFVFIWFLLHWVHRLVQKGSRVYKKEYSFYLRIFDMLYMLFTIVISFFVLLSVLYFFGDWVLLAIAIIFILGVAWASKQAIPLFWSEARLMMNFGPVRQGERVIYNGLPYEVESISLFSELVNRRLQGGNIRLPLRDLLGLRSRPSSEEEPWFPSECGDWILLNDGTYGRVAVQTPEIVELELLGGAHKTYKTLEYLSTSPVNLSLGFRLWITFGLDYSHQKIITRDVPSEIEKAVIESLDSEGYSDYMKRIKVEFKEVGSSSLDVVIMADFNGKAGPLYKLLSRFMQRVCAETCNRNQWIIPFQQIRVHMAGSSDVPS